MLRLQQKSLADPIRGVLLQWAQKSVDFFLPALGANNQVSGQVDRRNVNLGLEKTI